MTWRELKQQLDQIPESELDKDVQAWGEDIPLTEVSLEKCLEDMYYCDDWESESRPLSFLDEEEIISEDVRLVAEKGMFYLYIY